MNELEILDLENEKLIQDIMYLYKEVMEAELIHYRSRDIKQAKKRNEEFIKIKNMLQDKFDDIYDL